MTDVTKGHRCGYADTRGFGPCGGPWWIARNYFAHPVHGSRHIYACEAHAKLRNSMGGITFRLVKAKVAR